MKYIIYSLMQYADTGIVTVNETGVIYLVYN